MRRSRLWAVAAVLGLLAGGAAWAQGNGPITGIPAGIGANGSMRFTPTPQNQFNAGAGAAAPPVAGPRFDAGRAGGSRRHRARRR